jgi:hypothetical protein
MHGSDRTSRSLFSYVDVEARLPAKHPLRTIRSLVNDVLASLDADFDLLGSLRAPAHGADRLQSLVLFRWFVGLGIDDPFWDHR